MATSFGFSWSIRSQVRCAAGIAHIPGYGSAVSAARMFGIVNTSTEPAVAVKPRCILCKRDDRPPSVEHLFAAGLGVHADIELQRGAECEPCNNRCGRQIDEALVHLPEVQLVRGIWRVPDRKGRTVDSLELSSGTLKFDKRGAMNVVVHREGAVEVKDASTIVVSIATKRRRSGDQWRRVARAVLKMGLCTIRHEHGEEAALEPELDAARHAILGEPHTGFLLISPLDVHKQPDFSITVTGELPGMSGAVDFSYGGLRLVADLGLGPASAETLQWADAQGLHHMAITPLTT